MEVRDRGTVKLLSAQAESVLIYVGSHNFGRLLDGAEYVRVCDHGVQTSARMRETTMPELYLVVSYKSEVATSKSGKVLGCIFEIMESVTNIGQVHLNPHWSL